MSENPFEGFEVLSCYTWDDAVNDGMFVNVTGAAKEWGYKFPVALTQSFYSRFVEGNNDKDTHYHLTSILLRVRCLIRGKSSDVFPIFFEVDGENCIVATEGRSPQNPEPVITIMLASDY